MAKSVQYHLRLDPQQFAMDTGKVFRGLTITKKDNDYNIILRATDKEGVAIYALFQSESVEDGFKELLEILLSKQASYFWRFDGWANG